MTKWTEADIVKLGLKRVKSTDPSISQDELRRRYLLTIKPPKSEYEVQKLLSKYVEKYYPGYHYKVDAAGINMSKAAASKLKAVNQSRSWPDFVLYAKKGNFGGLFIELKTGKDNLLMTKDGKTRRKIGEKKLKNGSVIDIRENKVRKKGDWKNSHLEEQNSQIHNLRKAGYAAGFGVGLQKCLEIVDFYMNGQFDLMKQSMIVVK